MDKKSYEANIDEWEKRLHSSLTPVTPRDEFVKKLHQRLILHGDDDLEVWEPKDDTYLWVFLCILGGLVLTVTLMLLHWQSEKSDLDNAAA
jgi:hypothetical protein